jgi:hypothetical protein
VKKIAVVLIVAALLLTVALPVYAQPPANGGGPGAPALGTIYVTNQGLYYGTFVTVEPLPWTGHNQNSFQKLYDHTTDYGPGDPGYRGGRWWVDLNGNNEQDPEGIDHYVLCPLIPPGRETE